VWGGPATLLLFGIGFLIAGFIPPPSPDASVQQIVELYRDHSTEIRIGLILTMAGSALQGPYFSVLCVQMQRMEGVRPVFAYTQLALGLLGIIEFIFPLMIMLAITFRVGRDPQIVQAMYDVSWMMFLGVVSTFVLQLVVVGIAILGDQRDEPVMPRWVGYFSISTGLLFLPGGILVFFKTGPFAWNGLFVWWIPLVAFVAWFSTTALYLFKAISRDDYEPIGRVRDDRTLEHA
jgi:hypothetical protein